MSVRCLVFVGSALVGLLVGSASPLHAGGVLSGEAFGVYADVGALGVEAGIEETPHVVLPPNGGIEEDRLLEVTVPDTVSAATLHVSTMGKLAGNNAFVHSSAVVQDVDILNGLIVADAVVAQATSRGHTDSGQQKSNRLSSSGDGRLFGLEISGVWMGDVSPPPNTTIDLPGVRVILNEQLAGGDDISSTEMTVNMIRVILYTTVLGKEIVTGEIIVSSAHSGLDFDPGDEEVIGFVTGGGWIGDHPEIATFGFVAGNKRSGLHGSLQYIDHGEGLNVHMHSIDWFMIEDDECATFSGPARLNGMHGFTVTVATCDGGEPGVGVDRFAITVTDSDGYVLHENEGTLSGGNIQMHAR